MTFFGAKTVAATFGISKSGQTVLQHLDSFNNTELSESIRCGQNAEDIAVQLDIKIILRNPVIGPNLPQAAKAAASGTFGIGRGMEEVVGDLVGPG